MANTALGLALQISATTAGLAESVNNVNKRLDALAESGERSAKRLSVLQNIQLARAFIQGVTAAAAALQTAARSAVDLFNASRDSLDAVGKLATQTGISAENIQSFQLAASEAGVSNEQFARSLQRLSRSLGEVDFEAEENAFSAIGLDAQRLIDLDPGQAFVEVADALGSIANDAQRAAAANDIFGRNGVALVPLFTQGADGLRALREEADQLGLIVSDEGIRGVERMNDLFGRVAASIQGIINQVTAQLAPGLAAAAEQFLDLIKQTDLQSLSSNIADTILSFADTFLQGLQVFVKALGRIAEGITALLVNFNLVSQTDEEKELAELTAKATVSEVIGKNTANPVTTREFRPTADQAARIAELREIIAAEANFTQSVVSGLQSVRDSIAQTREATAAAAEAAQAAAASSQAASQATGSQAADDALVSAIDAAVESGEPLSFDDLLTEAKKTNRLLSGNRDIPPVEILGGA